MRKQTELIIVLRDVLPFTIPPIEGVWVINYKPYLPGTKELHKAYRYHYFLSKHYGTYLEAIEFAEVEYLTYCKALGWHCVREGLKGTLVLKNTF